MGLSIEQLQEKSGQYFKSLKCEKLLATNDGAFFELSKKEFAQSHATTIGSEVYEITAKPSAEKPSKKDKKKKK